MDGSGKNTLLINHLQQKYRNARWKLCVRCKTKRPYTILPHIDKCKSNTRMHGFSNSRYKATRMVPCATYFLCYQLCVSFSLCSTHMDDLPIKNIKRTKIRIYVNHNANYNYLAQLAWKDRRKDMQYMQSKIDRHTHFLMSSTGIREVAKWTQHAKHGFPQF